MTEISVWLTLKDEANLTTVLTGIKTLLWLKLVN